MKIIIPIVETMRHSPRTTPDCLFPSLYLSYKKLHSRTNRMLRGDQMEGNAGVWMSILEYAQFKSISISTIRRYIKADRVKTKKENGKFYIHISPEKIKERNHSEETQLRIQLENERLKSKIILLEEELNDLKMLVQIYEQSKQRQEPPEIPVS